MSEFTAQDVADAYDAGAKDGFGQALGRVNAYAGTIASGAGPICTWFAKNCRSFEPEINASERRAET